MLKKTTKIFTTIIVIASIFYYLGTLNLHKGLLVKKVTQNQNETVTPTVTPYPTINTFDTLKTVKDGVEYLDKKYGVSFVFPQNFSINGTACNISLERFTEVPHSPMWNYIHFAIIPKDEVDKCDWVVHGGQEDKYSRLMIMKVGETSGTSDAYAPGFFEYTRLPDETIGKNTFKHFVSYKVWESSENTNEHVYEMDNEKYTLWIMGLTNEDSSYPDSIPFDTLKKVVNSFNSR